MMIISWFEARQIQLHKELILWLLTTYIKLTMCQMLLKVHSVQFSSVAQSCPAPCDPMNHSMPGHPVHHQLPESIQTHVHLVGDAIQPPYPLSSPSPPAFNLPQHQGLFQWVNSSHQIAKSIGASASVLPMNIQGWFYFSTPKSLNPAVNNYEALAMYWDQFSTH